MSYRGFVIVECADGSYDILYASDDSLLDGEFTTPEQCMKYIDDYLEVE